MKPINKKAIIIGGIAVAAASAVAGYFFFKKKKAVEEDAVCVVNPVEDDAEVEVPVEESEDQKAAKVAANKPPIENFIDYSGFAKKVVQESVDAPKRLKTDPEDISPSEFGELYLDGFITRFLLYYEDDILADEDNEVIMDEDVHKLVGDNFQSYFDKYEKDKAYIRNAIMRIDICIDRIHAQYNNDEG